MSDASDFDKKPGTVCWTELTTPDAEAAKKFYGDLFGWTAQAMEGPMPYFFMNLPDGEPAAGMFQTGPEMGDVPPHWMSYFLVEDIGAAVARVEPLGGTVIRPVMEIPGKGKMATVQDPTGAVFSFWQQI